MIIENLSSGVYGGNCYIISSDDNSEGIVIDPADNTNEIIDFIERHNIEVKYIVLTHGHGDHIGGIGDLKQKTNAQILIHKEDREMLMNKELNLSSKMPMVTTEIEPDRVLEDGQIIDFGELNAEIIHTPGHTRGCISIKIGNNIFTGDTLFKGSIGRTDLYGGSYDDIIKSIENKLMIYDDEVTIYPGHGGSSTIGYERKVNPFLNKG
ncbi:MBL fold metallo-hydrolase [Senegalia massiliensis]|uniref:MBL fold metallo-hydrolase n=1 Tax=Senegalia massiliensis TaxID=1720316 RepID=A0A845QVI9_9CLOT|nr:MBL fold metallo-hydrolase [Senegalia massiliensis]NBI06927.1 MBL fold metallo-hydrolase [Senegalia massiliensis]